MNDAIDIVIPWVDGSDPEWQKEKNKVTQSLDGDQRPNRYRDWGTLKYLFRGIEEFTPWINKVHFITWGHLPPWLNRKHSKLNIVNHKDYIPLDYLPTFSSNTIELNIHRIKGLSEQFIYANDDTFFASPISSDFFFKGGLPVDAAIQNVLQFCREDGIDHIVANDLLCINANFSKRAVISQSRSKWYNIKYGKGNLKNLYLTPFSKFTGFFDPHLPNSYLKATYEEVWDVCGDKLDETCRHAVRNHDDVNQWLFRYWQFVTGKFESGRLNRGCFFSIGKDDERIKKFFLKCDAPIVCLNDDEVNIDFEKEKAFLIECFEKILPRKSGFEK